MSALKADRKAQVELLLLVRGACRACGASLVVSWGLSPVSLPNIWVQKKRGLSPGLAILCFFDGVRPGGLNALARAFGGLGSSP